MEQYSPQLYRVYEDCIARNTKFAGAYEKLRLRLLQEVIGGNTFFVRCMTASALGTSQDSPHKTTILIAMLIFVGHQWLQVDKSSNKPFLRGGWMSSKVPATVKSESAAAPYNALFMMSPTKNYEKDEYGDRITNLDMIQVSDVIGKGTAVALNYLCAFLFQRMKPSEGTKREMETIRKEWTQERKKCTRSGGRRTRNNLADDDDDNFLVLDMSSSEASAKSNTYSDESDNEDEDDDDDDEDDEEQEYDEDDDEEDEGDNILDSDFQPSDDDGT